MELLTLGPASFIRSRTLLTVASRSRNTGAAWTAATLITLSFDGHPVGTASRTSRSTPRAVAGYVPSSTPTQKTSFETEQGSKRDPNQPQAGGGDGI